MRTTLLLAGTLALGLVAYLLFFFDRDDTSLDPAEAGFAVEDTSTVHRIVMRSYRKDRMTQEVILQRQPDGDWLLNDLYPALRPRVQHLLKVMHRLEVREVLNQAGERTANQFFEVMRTEVEIMDQAGRYLKHYYVGSETPDARGTLMRMAESETPYVVEMPGLQGYVKASYALDPLLWRANRLFVADTARLQSLRLEYVGQPEDSWTLQRQSEGSWGLAEGEADPQRLNTLLSKFKGLVYAETFANNDYPGRQQQLAEQTPDLRLRAQYRDGSGREIVVYDRPDNPNNLFGWVVGEEELLTIQHVVLDPFLPTRRYLTGESDVRGTGLDPLPPL
jgi:hypothetical protein